MGSASRAALDLFRFDETELHLTADRLDQLDQGQIRRNCYALLGLICFFTVGEDEVRAWSIARGTRAQDAAGAVHSDIARGFIRAEVVAYDDLVLPEGSMATVRDRGQFRLEGKEYGVHDGEIGHFRLNVVK